MAADIDDPRAPGTNTSIPALFALDIYDGSLSWATSMGFGKGYAVGHASPVVIDGWLDANA